MRDPSDAGEPRVRVDEQVVRTVLQMNPELRRGRTAQELKRLLEDGGSPFAGGAPGARVPPQSEASPVAAAPDRRSHGEPGARAVAPAPEPGSRAAPAPARPTPRGPASPVEDAVDSFLRAEAGAVHASLDDLAARRRALDAEELAAKTRARERLASFLAVLDREALEAHGASALARHEDLLRLVGATAAGLLDTVRRTRR